MIGLLAKILPFLGPLIERIFPDRSKAAELAAEKELIEARAFSRGRISPRYLFQYFIVGVFAVIILWMLAHAVVPAHVASPYTPVEKLLSLVAKAYNVIFSGAGD